MYTLVMLAALLLGIDASGNCANGVCSAQAAPRSMPANPMNWGACASGSCNAVGGSCSTSGSCSAVSARRSRGSCSSASAAGSCGSGARRGILFHRR